MQKRIIHHVKVEVPEVVATEAQFCDGEISLLRNHRGGALGTPSFYAIDILGDQMAPALAHGAVAWVDARREPGAGDNVVVHIKGGHGFVAELVSCERDAITFRQHNPTREFSRPPTIVKAMHVIARVACT